MDGLGLHPELFEQRTLAMERLEAHGFNWLEHFGSIDLLHDTFGLEVCAIGRKHDAERIRSILVGTFPGWSFSDVYYQPDGADLGWKMIIHRDHRKPLRYLS